MSGWRQSGLHSFASDTKIYGDLLYPQVIVVVLNSQKDSLMRGRLKLYSDTILLDQNRCELVSSESITMLARRNHVATVFVTIFVEAKTKTKSALSSYRKTKLK